MCTDLYFFIFFFFFILFYFFDRERLTLTKADDQSLIKDIESRSHLWTAQHICRWSEECLHMHFRWICLLTKFCPTSNMLTVSHTPICALCFHSHTYKLDVLKSNAHSINPQTPEASSKVNCWDVLDNKHFFFNGISIWPARKSVYEGRLKSS